MISFTDIYFPIMIKNMIETGEVSNDDICHLRSITNIIALQ